MDLSLFFEFGLTVYESFGKLASFLVNVKLRDHLGWLYNLALGPSFIPSDRNALQSFVLSVLDMTWIEFALCSSVSVVSLGLGWAVAKWILDIVN